MGVRITAEFCTLVFRHRNLRMSTIIGTWFLIFRLTAEMCDDVRRWSCLFDHVMVYPSSIHSLTFHRFTKFIRCIEGSYAAFDAVLWAWTVCILVFCHSVTCISCRCSAVISAAVIIANSIGQEHLGFLTQLVGQRASFFDKNKTHNHHIRLYFCRTFVLASFRVKFTPLENQTDCRQC